jgi:hypothetical protein
VSIWNTLFNRKKSDSEVGRNQQLPSSMINEIFGEVDVRPNGTEKEVFFTILMGLSQEGYQTGVAIDASASMQSLFGKGLVEIKGKEPPQKLLEDYMGKGWLRFEKYKGEDLPVLTFEGKLDLVENGYFIWSENQVQPSAREFVHYLANTVADENGTSVIYWACGDGSQVEEVGDFTPGLCAEALFEGPKDLSFGAKTILLPAVRHFVERFSGAERALYLFITDGVLHDLEEVKAYTVDLCHKIASGEMNPIKCVLIGLGVSIDETQMQDLDDVDSGTDIDIWDHKIAKDMRSLAEIFSELVEENQKAFEGAAKIHDSLGSELLSFRDGLPARVRFSMPADSKWFELEVMGQKIRQSVEVDGS